MRVPRRGTINQNQITSFHRIRRARACTARRERERERGKMSARNTEEALIARVNELSLDVGV